MRRLRRALEIIRVAAMVGGDAGGVLVGADRVLVAVRRSADGASGVSWGAALRSYPADAGCACWDVNWRKQTDAGCDEPGGSCATGVWAELRCAGGRTRRGTFWTECGGRAECTSCMHREDER